MVLGGETLLAELPELTTEVHQQDLLTIPELDNQFTYNSLENIGRFSFIQIAAGGEFDRTYIDDLKFIERSLSFNAWLKVDRDNIDSLANSLGSKALAGAYDALGQKVEDTRENIDVKIKKNGGIYLSITNNDTWQKDEAIRHARLKGETTEESPNGSFDYSGERVGKIMSCVGFDETSSHFSFKLQGRSGQNYLYVPGGKTGYLNHVLADRTKIFTTQPTFPIKRKY